MIRLSEQARDLETWFPGVLVWWGSATGRWWALAPWCPGALVEAADLSELYAELVKTTGDRGPWQR